VLLPTAKQVNASPHQHQARLTQISKGVSGPDQGPVGWFSHQAAKKNLQPQDIWLKNCIYGCQDA